MDTLQPITWPQIKANRDRLLVESDWTQLYDTVLSSEERAAWQSYRQALGVAPGARGLGQAALFGRAEAAGIWASWRTITCPGCISTSCSPATR